VLWYLTVGAVRGFAFFLGLSTACDLIVSYFFTRPMVLLLARTKWMERRKVMGIEVANAAAKTCGELADVEVSDRSNAGMTPDDLLPGRLQVIPHRGNDPHAGYYNSPALHGFSMTPSEAVRYYSTMRREFKGQGTQYTTAACHRQRARETKMRGRRIENRLIAVSVQKGR
jgi:hypothetical protein